MTPFELIEEEVARSEFGPPSGWGTFFRCEGPPCEFCGCTLWSDHYVVTRDMWTREIRLRANYFKETGERPHDAWNLCFGLWQCLNCAVVSNLKWSPFADPVPTRPRGYYWKPDWRTYELWELMGLDEDTFAEETTRHHQQWRIRQEAERLDLLHGADGRTVHIDRMVTLIRQPLKYIRRPVVEEQTRELLRRGLLHHVRGKNA